jgi:predicted ATPase/class 3 adenylate cyclase
MSAAEPSNETSIASPIRAFLFTDIEGSTRLWEVDGERMRAAVARHDAISRHAVLDAGGQVVKTTGDGVHAVFDEAHQAVTAALRLQQAFAAPVPDGGLALKVRCGVHCGESEARDGDYFGPALNRAARVMGAAHGGQTLVTQAVYARVSASLPADATLLDLGTVRLRDLASPERVYQLQHPSLRAVFPPLRSLEATPNNLAQQLNSFVGRERELAEVRALLAKTRLLTLLGMGGIGKSRLSVQLGAELLDEYPDGVWLVELAPLADSLLVPQALASVLGVKEDQGGSVIDALLRHVRDKTMLVILDNCEHVVHACADLAKRLLQASAGLRILGSSRDMLQVAGETVYPVPTLSVPADEGGEAEERTLPPAHLARLARHEAVRLFMDRATAVQPGLQLSGKTAGAVAQICRQLDGIPLALELAAARTRVLSVQAIAARLKDRFKLLVSGDQTVLPRQRTLRALIDWSHELLSQPERALFARLSVFAGGWTLEAAEAVCADAALDAADVLDLLAQLVQKSLVVMEPGGERYRMLETVRAYAAEKLHDEAATRRRHVAHYLSFAESARSHLAGPEQAQWLALLDTERENLLSAHGWCGSDAACRDNGLQLVFLLKIYWHARGLLSLGYRVTLEALQRTGAGERTFARCRVLCDAGQLACHMGRYAEARGYLEQSHAIAIELADKQRLSAVLPPLGMVLVATGEPALAMPVYEAAAALAAELGQHRQHAVAINSLAQLHRAEGSLGRAEALYRQALVGFEAIEDHEGAAITKLNLAMVAITGGELQAALAWLQPVHEATRSLGSQPLSKSLIEVTAGLCAARGDGNRCATLYGAAEALGVRTGIRRASEDDAYLQPLIARAQQLVGPVDFERYAAAGRDAGDTSLDALLLGALEGGRLTP